jgi:VIT1/CCC1 family predicted Fe2+/Mn2+ transporter
VTQQSDQRSLGELFGDLSRQMSALVRQEIELARAEVTGKATSAARDVAVMAAGLALLYAGLLVLLGAVVLFLADAGVTPWLAALIVAIVAAVIGGLLVMASRQALANRDMAPKRTVETLKDDAEWAKERIK